MDRRPPAAAASLAPGFRFHPTDDELVWYYLRRKVTGKPFRLDAISDIDIYKTEPWDLPGMSKLKSRDLEWYFFSVLDKKYSNGAKTNRATEKGYWKTTGKDRPVFHRGQSVGMKKTLVFHTGRAPKGARSNWVMHEYRIVDEELEKAGISPREAFVLCRVFQKSGTGPKNGEQYGAPLIEDEWENDDLVMVPGEITTGEVDVADDTYLDGDEFEQVFEKENPSEEIPLPDTFYYGDEGIQAEQPENFDPQNPSEYSNGCGIIPEEFDGQELFHLPVEDDMKIVKHEYISESSFSVDSEEVDYLIDEPYMDAMINPPNDDMAFLEASDLSNPPVKDSLSIFDNVEDHLGFFDADEESYLHTASCSSKATESENFLSDQMPLIKQDVDDGASQENAESEEVLQSKYSNAASTSNHDPTYFDSAKDKNFTDIKYPPFLKQASCNPSKGLSLGASRSSSSIHVTAGIVRIGNISMTFDLRKNLEVDIVFTFGDSQVNEDEADTLSSKSAYLMTRFWYYLMIFIWVMILPLSLKIGSCFYNDKTM